MRKIKIIAMAAAFAFSLASTDALADCAADIKDIEAQKDRMDPRAGLVEVLEKMIKKAKKAQVQGKTKRCAKIVKKAQAKLDRASPR